MAVSSKHHVACFISDDGIRMRGGIVKELMDQFFVFFVGLDCCDAREPSPGNMVLSTQQA